MYVVFGNAGVRHAGSPLTSRSIWPLSDLFYVASTMLNYAQPCSRGKGVRFVGHGPRVNYQPQQLNYPFLRSSASVDTRRGATRNAIYKVRVLLRVMIWKAHMVASKSTRGRNSTWLPRSPTLCPQMITQFVGVACFVHMATVFCFVYIFPLLCAPFFILTHTHTYLHQAYRTPRKALNLPRVVYGKDVSNGFSNARTIGYAVLKICGRTNWCEVRGERDKIKTVFLYTEYF